MYDLYSYAEGDGETKDLSLNDKITYTVNPREKQRFEFIPQENGVYTLNVFYERTANMNGQASFTHEGIQVPFNYTSYENADDYFKNYYNEFYGVKGNSYILEFEDYFGS